MSTALSNPMITPEEKVFHPKPPRLRLPPRMLRVNFTATSGMSDPIVQREKSKDKDREQEVHLHLLLMVAAMRTTTKKLRSLIMMKMMKSPIKKEKKTKSMTLVK